MTQQSPNLSLDYLMPEQAQKHITINEALRRLDALVHLSVISSTQAAPPPEPANGARYLVPATATGAWAEHAGMVAYYQDTGWQFIAPRPGWRLWNEQTQTLLVYDGKAWQNITAGAATGASMQQTDITLNFATSPLPRIDIPTHVLFLGITGRVTHRLVGANRWRVGVAADSSRFGSALGAAVGSTLIGLANPPAVYWEQTPLQISGEGGTLRGGIVKLSLYYLSLPVPSA